MRGEEWVVKRDVLEGVEEGGEWGCVLGE
jgi:hypothetical protein